MGVILGYFIFKAKKNSDDFYSFSVFSRKCGKMCSSKEKNMSKAIYPGTFDPLTLGHIDIVERALHIFDEVTIAIAVSEKKVPLFSLEERIDQIEKIFDNDKRIKAIGFSGLIVDLAKQEGSNVLVRGLRAVSDFEYEFQMASMNRAMSPDLDSIFLTPKAKYSFLSSSLVREIASMGGEVSEFVDPIVESALKDKFK